MIEARSDSIKHDRSTMHTRVVVTAGRRAAACVLRRSVIGTGSSARLANHARSSGVGSGDGSGRGTWGPSSCVAHCVRWMATAGDGTHGSDADGSAAGSGGSAAGVGPPGPSQGAAADPLVSTPEVRLRGVARRASVKISICMQCIPSCPFQRFCLDVQLAS
jgi:hypothetical protein